MIEIEILIKLIYTFDLIFKGDCWALVEVCTLLFLSCSNSSFHCDMNFPSNIKPAAWNFCLLLLAVKVNTQTLLTPDRIVLFQCFKCRISCLKNNINPEAVRDLNSDAQSLVVAEQTLANNITCAWMYNSFCCSYFIYLCVVSCVFLRAALSCVTSAVLTTQYSLNVNFVWM